MKTITHWQLLQVHSLACSFGGHLEQAAEKISAANSTETSGTSAAEVPQLPWGRSSHCLLLLIWYSSCGMLLSTTRCSLTTEFCSVDFKNSQLFPKYNCNCTPKVQLLPKDPTSGHWEQESSLWVFKHFEVACDTTCSGQRHYMLLQHQCFGRALDKK